MAIAMQAGDVDAVERLWRDAKLLEIGGGTLCVPYSNAFGFPVHRAVGTAAAIGLVIALPATIGFVVTG